MTKVSSASRLSVLLSAMQLDDWHYIDNLNISGNALVINQCDRDGDERIEDGDRKIRFISTRERGLSKSRNMALREAEGEICIFCDNDVKYRDNYEELILGEFRRMKDADIIVFFIERPERHSPIFKKRRRMGYLSTMKTFSPELAFRKSSLVKAGLKLDEDFGAGARYSMGEENIFLYDAIKAGLRIYYAPVKIASLIENESTWFKGYNERFFINRGAGYYRMAGFFSHILIWQFALRKKKEYSKDKMSLRDALRYMYKGAHEYEREKNLSGR
ncbi:MAG: glycosyltransferase family 2 protein [Lachnospiraceae bacterium]|nr:glycosyltransferase family 2 protein [Lachnospiraceae bacterium]